MLSNVSSDIFQTSDSIKLLPVVSAEWNHNLFNPPYLTVAGSGSQVSKSLTSGTVIDVTSGGKPNFTTKKFSMSGGKGKIEYTISSGTGSAYKIVTYVKTNSPIPVMITASGKGSGLQYGSEQAEADSLGWTKVTTYVGSSSASETFSSFVYTIAANSLSGLGTNAEVSFTVPEIYATTYFDYQNHSLFPTEIPFTYSRPGESYVQTGDSKYSFPSSYRKITSQVLKGYTSATYSPVSSILQNPQFLLASSPVPVLKNALATDISPYKYFVSDKNFKSITAIYEKPITTNKIVIKLNTIMTVPTINISIDGSNILVDGSQNIVPPNNADGKCLGILTLYWDGFKWTKTKWTTMPHFNSTGTLSLSTTFSKITVTQVSKVNNPEFLALTGDKVSEDLSRMHIIEVSPRLEIDLTSFVQDLSINKSLDANSGYLPLSSLNTNDAQITLSGIPAMNGSTIVPIFSSQSNQSSTILSNMLRKNIKFYVNFHLQSYATPSSTVTTDTYIPGGVFYSDSWSENDIQTISVQCFDFSRYLQSTPVPDYVANLKSVFDIVTNILDLAGFTDYDYDSLYAVCNNKAAPLDISYYYCNSQDSTIVDALNQIFVAYQIGAYIDEYGIMKFLSLQNILSSSTSNIDILEYNIMQGGFSISNQAKPGKISLRYQTPKIKQSPSIQNVKDVSIKDSPSFVYTTSNDVVWAQQTTDSVGFNYLNADMDSDSNVFNINNNDLLDIFHTFNMSNDGFAFIENEVVSFVYKEYKISKVDDSDPVYVSIKNSIELSSEIDRFIKENTIGLKTSDGTEKVDYDVKVTPTGNITNVQRGLFGTYPSSHKRISTLQSKNLSEGIINSSFNVSSGSGNTSIINNQLSDAKLPDLKKILIKSEAFNKTIVFPTQDLDIGYGTYSVKFNFTEEDGASAGLFFNMSSPTLINGAYFLELSRYNKSDPKTGGLYSPAQYRYLLSIYDDSGETIAWSDVTGECNSIVSNFSKILKKTTVGNVNEYSYVTDDTFNLKLVHYLSDGTDGENATILENKRVVSAFINNVEVSGWQVPGDLYDEDTDPNATGWKTTNVNTITGMRQKPSIPNNISINTRFGFFASREPQAITNLYPEISSLAITSIYPASLREIHATVKPLKERSVSYFYQDREFLNGIVQNQPLYSNSKTYIMQTTPEISGINYYDVQYQTPAAVSVDVLPIEYKMSYYPGNAPEDQTKYQVKIVDEYSLAYSTPINTGFRARLAVANGAPNMVFLKKDSDELNDLTINFNLWTHEIIAPSDAEIVEKIVDYSNLSEVVQLDSEWIQSKHAAQRILKVVQMGLEGFSKNVSLSIFGNPLIQVGDVVRLSYNLNGIYQQRYLVHSVSQSFTDGLETSLQLKRIEE
jgi:hypothetical protein